MLIADRRLYLTKDKESVVEEGDPRAAFLFAPIGFKISAADVEKFGLGKDPDPDPEPPIALVEFPKPEPESEPEPVEAKMAENLENKFFEPKKKRKRRRS